MVVIPVGKEDEDKEQLIEMKERDDVHDQNQDGEDEMTDKDREDFLVCFAVMTTLALSCAWTIFDLMAHAMLGPCTARESHCFMIADHLFIEALRLVISNAALEYRLRMDISALKLQFVSSSFSLAILISLAILDVFLLEPHPVQNFIFYSLVFSLEFMKSTFQVQRTSFNLLNMKHLFIRYGILLLAVLLFNINTS